MNTHQNANKDDGQTPSEALVEQTRICMLQRKADRLQREVNALRAERRMDNHPCQAQGRCSMSIQWISVDDHLPEIEQNDIDDLHTSAPVIALTSERHAFRACRARWDDEQREWWAIEDFGGMSETTDTITHFVYYNDPIGGAA